ncbi:zinc ABC transporter substrate-binding protein [Loktanella sp. TSTF-M6]|uniref:High-affinity zinc uptake system protein ZnuA n=1 Tax=Loktanella gaetbuli TaxID=2881335 RepID=A0ABS8BV42_9RHOB|nr:zinc ABC transporter substrate-binding protein [Loktanella gaetbuli]MCB5199613.1 zinc ABC transporter substrate-binding protein [Loktanella gaetbuli]
MLRLTTTTALVMLSTTAMAEVPRVLTDIAPIHSLVAQVMGDLGAPDLLVPAGGDAHHMALRPSDARLLDQAQVVVWVGESLTPWLDEPLRTLAPTAATLTLQEVAGWTPRMYTEADDHAGHEGHEDHADHDNHDDHADHDHEHDHAGDDHAGHDDHSGHAHTGLDPHAWLDPVAAKVWVGAIRDTLTATDPDNAATYAANAAGTMQRLDTLTDQLTTTLAGVPAGSWLAPHDAFGYFEDRFTVPSAGAVADSEAVAPGAAGLSDLRERVSGGNVSCVLFEVNTADDLARTLTDGTTAKTAAISVAGAGLEPGPALYSTLLTSIADTLVDCTAS